MLSRPPRRQKDPSRVIDAFEFPLGHETIDEPGIVTANGIYTRSWTITPTTTDATVVVTVSWNEDGITRSVVLRSKRTNTQ